MKNERNIFRLQCEPRSLVPREDHHARLIEYDDRMRKEEKKYSQLLMELNKSRWLNQSRPHKNDDLNGFSKYAVDQTVNEDQSVELEMTRLTGDEILYGGSLTMDQALLKRKKLSELYADERLDRTGIQQDMMFHSTRSLQERNDIVSPGKEVIRTAGYDKFKSQGRESFPWESVMVESVRLVLRHWRAVRSFSLSAVSTRNIDDINVIYNLSSENQCRTVKSILFSRGE